MRTARRKCEVQLMNACFLISSAVLEHVSRAMRATYGMGLAINQF